MDLLHRKKTELHCHLDGSLPAHWLEETLQRKLKREQISVGKDCPSLTEYLEKFNLPLTCLQKEKQLEQAAFAVAAEAAEENITCLELRFAPVLHENGGMDLAQVIRAVDRGIKQAEKTCSIRAGIIVCAMRHHTLDQNLRMLEEAVRLKETENVRIAALDLAGDENGYPNDLFRELFKRARELNIPFTIHSGETGSLENVKLAYEYGAKRIGHGIALRKDPGLMRAFAEAGIGVEMCPTSNFQTKAAESWKDYPLPAFLEAGIPVSINTDNRTVSNTTLTEELQLVYEHFGRDEGMLETLLKNAGKTRFLTE